MTYDEVAAYLRLSKSTVMSLASPQRPPNKRLPVRRLSHRTVRIRRSDLEEWIRNQRL